MGYSKYKAEYDIIQHMSYNLEHTIMRAANAEFNMQSNQPGGAKNEQPRDAAAQEHADFMTKMGVPEEKVKEYLEGVQKQFEENDRDAAETQRLIDEARRGL